MMSMSFPLVRRTVLLAALASACAPAHAQEAVTSLGPSVSRQVFSESDLNRDGFVSLDEYHKDIVRSFHALDFNRDGYISEAEVRALPTREDVKALKRLLRRADLDGDGRLSFKEVVQVRMQTFDEADTNRDDQLSLEEALAFDAKVKERMRQAREARRAAASDKPAR
jgi:hypothetical protein